MQLRRKTRNYLALLIVIIISVSILSCSSGTSITDNTGVESTTANSSCSGSCASASTFLSVTDVETIIAQAVAEAQARGQLATVAVVDRVGNVLAVFRMTGADSTITISSGTSAAGGLEGVNIIPDGMVAIAKAVTAAYLSTEGNAFTTRTASQIIQNHFNPGEDNQPSGPLFGVQFSQLPCSDFSQRYAGGAADAGPKRSPLGLSADPGGLPLYKGGTPVGAIGVISDSRYSLDLDPSNYDSDNDELIAMAGSFGYAAPVDRRADRISVLGKFLRFVDATFADLATSPASATSFATINGSVGSLIAVSGYHDGAAVIAGTAFGQAPSGIRADTADFAAGLNAYVLVDNADTERYPPNAGTDTPAGNAANALTASEVRQVLSSALDVANKARAQIRRPLGSPARVTIAVVDTNGAILGVVRSRDAPVFGSDVAVQKARTASFFSGTGTSTAPADAINALPAPVYLDGGLSVLASPSVSMPDYVTSAQAFLGNATALESGGANVAFSDRAGGNLSRPTFPDGPAGGPPGPFSKPAGQWSVFSTGLQSDLIYNALIHHVGFVAGAVGADIGSNCTGDTGLGGFASVNAVPRIANGIQIFPGSVPIYRGGVLVGGIGVSGDGVDQDDLIAFVGLDRAGKVLASGIGNAPRNLRADLLTPQGTRLRYVSCPITPFNNSSDQDVCDAL